VLPGFDGGTGWLEDPPPTPEQLRGKVILVDFGTYTCVNWIRTLPYLRAWTETYGPHGLAVVTVHTPEFSVEHDLARVRRAARAMGLVHPIVLDNDYAIWTAFGNHYWPARYLAGPDGHIRYRHFGEGDYEGAERAIRRLLEGAGFGLPPGEAPVVEGHGLEAPADWDQLRSPETYLGLARTTGFASPGGGAAGVGRDYTVPNLLRPDEWALAGTWTLDDERVTVAAPNGHIALRFQARDVNLILAPPAGGSPVPFRVWLDGQPGRSHGIDVDEAGDGVVDEPRLYQLVRQAGRVEDRLFEIEFAEPGASAFCFTFG
jgi:hypothetical protein